MKVISIKEPYATLIKEKKKYIETRSWKTTYRGEIYIHASISSNLNKLKSDIKELFDEKQLNHGNIICKCKLVDCIYMTKEFVEDMKQNNYQEYLCGLYEEGRYAWILKDVEKINPIPAKGQLNIWNYYNENEILNLMDNIKYGWIDKNNITHSKINELFKENYKLQSSTEILKSKVGVCWDQVELERYYFKPNQNNIKTYFIMYINDKDNPTHTFLTYEKDNKYYWFEHAWEQYKGIHEYISQEEMLKDIKIKFRNKYLEKNTNNNIYLYKYNKPQQKLSVQEFITHCTNSTLIEI